MSRPKVIILLGTTASGKTKLGVKLAANLNGEIISADSRQVYKGMDIGTGKDLIEYKVIIPPCPRGRKKGGKKIPHHLIDIVNPKTQFTLARWLKLTHRAMNDILKREKTPMIVGGTGLYINALIKGYQLPPAKLDKKLRSKLNKLTLNKLLIKLKKLDFQTYQKIDKKNHRRVQRALEIILQTKKPLSEQIPPCQRGGKGLPAGRQGWWEKQKPLFNLLILGLTYPKNILYQRIDKRVEERLKQGMVREIKKLHQQGVSWQRLEDFGLEYRFIAQYLQGKITYEEMKEKLKIAIHQFAKRQMTWFKKMSNIHWIKNYSQAKKLVKKYLLP